MKMHEFLHAKIGIAIAFSLEHTELPTIFSVKSFFLSNLAEAARLRSPNRNEDLSKTTASLKDIYKSSYNRVGE